MRPFTFNPGPRLLAGPDQAGALAEKLPPGPCLLVTDRDLVRLGLTDAYREAIGASRDVIVFDAVEADPSKETLLAATDAGRAAGVSSVIGLGGGSPMDVAKLAAYLLGEATLDEAIAAGQQATRRYAKRQYTWFAHQPPTEWLRFREALDLERLAEALALLGPKV